LLLGNVGFDLVSLLLGVSHDGAVGGLQVHAQHHRSLADEGLKDTAPKALSRARDEGNLSFETAGHCDTRLEHRGIGRRKLGLSANAGNCKSIVNRGIFGFPGHVLILIEGLVLSGVVAQLGLGLGLVEGTDVAPEFQAKIAGKSDALRLVPLRLFSLLTTALLLLASVGRFSLLVTPMAPSTANPTPSHRAAV
jgi:hypothetical protein